MTLRNQVLALALCTAAGCAAPPGDDAAAGRSELAIRTLLAGWESADTALIADLFSPQATYDDFPNQVTHQGIEEIVGYVTSAHAWGDDVLVNVGRVHASDGMAVAEWVFSAVQTRPLGAAVPVGTGREVVMNGVTIIELEGGRIVRAADYTDTAPLWLQVGGRIELPGGGTVELTDYGR